jgi:hypothetical protein
MDEDDPLVLRKASLDATEQALELLSDRAVRDRWQREERAALADERDSVADASDAVAASFDARAVRRDEEAVFRHVDTTSRNEHAVADQTQLEPGLYLRYQAAQDDEQTEHDRAESAADRERAAIRRDRAAGARRAAGDRDEAATDRATGDDPFGPTEVLREPII